jgi:hypothetical protein
MHSLIRKKSKNKKDETEHFLGYTFLKIKKSIKSLEKIDFC